MIHYTLSGHSYELEIHEDQIRLIRKSWLPLVTKRHQIHAWKISELSNFEVTVPKFLMISGKLQWTTFGGDSGAFYFTTNAMMVKKIEMYLQKKVIKNLQRETQGEQSKAA